MATVFAQTLREKVVVNENGQRKTMTKFEAAIKQFVNKAASGDLRALQLLMSLSREAEARKSRPQPNSLALSESDQKVIEGIMKRFQAVTGTRGVREMNVPASNEYFTMLRSDFFSFIERSFYQLNPDAEFLPNWHIEVMASELERCLRGETKRLIINVPPRSLESHCASVAFPSSATWTQAQCADHRPSYAQDLADKLAHDCRSLMNSDLYRKTFATRLASQAVAELTTEAQGFRLATSVGGVLTGRGGEFIIIDDPLKPEEAVSDTRARCGERVVRAHPLQPPQWTR